jgi:hypothetical protein
MQITDMRPNQASSIDLIQNPLPFKADRDVKSVYIPNGDSNGGAYSLELSPRALELSSAAEKQGAAAVSGGAKSALSHLGESKGSGAVGAVECQTCKNRRYKDDSNDSTVSFQTATRIAPGAEESQVRAHEQEHVSHEQLKAKAQGGEVVSQSVAIHYSICPECGKTYVSGGTTTTTTRSSVGGNPYGNTGQRDSDNGVSLLA